MADIKRALIGLILLAGITWLIITLINLGAYDLQYLFILVMVSILFGYFIGNGGRTPRTNPLPAYSMSKTSLPQKEVESENLIDKKRIPEEFQQEEERFKNMFSHQ